MSIPNSRIQFQSFSFLLCNWSCVTSVHIVHWFIILNSQQDSVSSILCILLIMFYFSIHCAFVYKKNPLLQKWGRPDQEKRQRRDPIWLGCQRRVRQYSEKVRLSHGQLTAEEDGQTKDYDTSILIDNFHIAEKSLGISDVEDGVFCVYGY